jgi:1-acyl-sn-glycerol-3-phosphate acyltransferase
MTENFQPLTYPRRFIVRRTLRTLINAALSVVCDFEITGQENFPSSGPLIVVGNHFSFLDPVAVIGASPWPLEFLGGTRMPNAPGAISWITRVYGVLPVRRGSLSRETLLAAEGILKQNGVLGIFPEAGNWATVLRPARPGAALLASRTFAQVLPVGLDGLLEVFPRFRRGQRARVTLNVGKPIGPFFVSERGTNDRKTLEEIGHTIMQHIAELIPPERRGHYSEDPAVREAARGTEIYPWNEHPEGD